jgi:hypothetical protein
MAGCSEDHVAAIGSLNLNFGLIDDLWLTWRPDGSLRWKVETLDGKVREWCVASRHL